VRIATRDVAAILRDIPEDVLMPALKLGQMQGSASVRFVLESIPRRLAERYVEDLEAMDEPSRKEGEAAQIEITKVILALSKAGTIKLMDRDAG
jgi:flagellar motor switch protein FliG